MKGKGKGHGKVGRPRKHYNEEEPQELEDPPASKIKQETSDGTRKLGAKRRGKKENRRFL